MSASHNHSHSHKQLNYNRAFAIGFILNAGFVVVEATYGFLTNSLALVADAGHNLSDVLGLVLAWGASFLSQRPPTKRYTYGLRRSSILAALLNAIILLLVMGGVAWESIRRFSNPSPIPGNVVIGVAIAGVIINTITALMFLSGRKRDINIRGAFLHMAADAMVSLGVVLAGVAILTTGWLWFDPAISLIVVAVVIINSWQLLWESLNLALDAVPIGIELLAVRTYLSELPGVIEVHDLHIWGMSSSEVALTAHLVMPNGHPGDAFLAKVVQELHDIFGIEHTTIQLEIGDPNNPCVLAPQNLV
ncbi:cation diffusion facilitator family transporter [Chlorogloeopsis fritschii PCC 9212]|uniref:Cobalt transporter n=1 Tax=Chlorogloeopsis fritschii PCC 6912 TaxID=211165 RepID=A0A433MY39_CHLFR|nr:cation diffusion facilitator family transporter [Chlorogloeopsis fritschii]MBF2008714.1 cation transporter [Chlorogloeopsis fritschii C42_A2020_084]RUR73188.1 cobalt transporter [Chlorogloeopsis fritschii PCC 6912]